METIIRVESSDHLLLPEVNHNIPLEMYRQPITQRALDRYIYCHKQNESIQECAENNKINNLIKKIKDAPGLERTTLIEQALNSDNVETQIIGADTIIFAPMSDRANLVKQALDSDNFEIQKRGAAVIIRYYLCWDDRINLTNYLAEIIHQKIESEDINKQLEGASLMRNAPIIALLEQALNSKYIEVQIKGMEMFQARPSIEIPPLNPLLINKVFKIATEALMSNDRTKQVRGMEMMEQLPEQKQKPLRDLIKSRELINIAIEPPLYLDKTLSDSYPERQSFTKTGSEITVIGGTLKGKTIIRSINPEAFLAWQKTYEDYHGWEKAGFDYIPIEPIQTYHFDKGKKLVNVLSGVLDLNLVSWNTRFALFTEELGEQRIKINKVLISQGINHNHPHRKNFALSLFRKQDQSIDFDRIPRLYLIDFDQATFY